MTTPNRQPRTWPASLAIFLLAVLVAAAFSFALPPRLRNHRSADFTSAYEPAARSILAGQGLPRIDGQPDTTYPPGFPIILAGLFGIARITGLDENLILQAFGILAHGLTALIVWQISRTIWSRRYAWLAAALVITYLPALWFTPLFTSALAFIPIFYAAIALFWAQLRRQGLSLAACFSIGVIAGISMMIHPLAAGCGLLLALLLAALKPFPFRGRAIAGALLLIIGNAMVVAPWLAWSYSQTRDVSMPARGMADAMVKGLTYARSQPDRPEVNIDDETRAFMSETHEEWLLGLLAAPTDVIRWIAKNAADRPATLALLLARKAGRSLYGTDDFSYEKRILAINAPYVMAGLVGILMALRWHGTARRLALIALSFLIYFWVATICTQSLARQIQPAMPLLFLIIPGIWVLLRSARARAFRYEVFEGVPSGPEKQPKRTRARSVRRKAGPELACDRRRMAL